MTFLRKNIFLILIFILCVFLRLNYDTFVRGYIFDEVAMVSIANADFFDIFSISANEDYHAPLYYLIAHFFMKLDNPDLYLRFLNIFFSIINVYVFYKIGKLLLNKNFGLVLALVLAVNHLQITIVNFIKFYCLSFLLFSLIIYYLIKYIKFNKNPFKLGMANAFFILSATFGFAFVFIEYFVLFVFKKTKTTLKSFLISLIGFILYLPILIVQIKYSLNAIISPHGDYPSVSFFAFYAFINDYFSPLVNYSCNVQTVESMPLLIRSIKTIIERVPFDWPSFLGFVFLSFIPVVIAIIGLINSYKGKLVRKILLIAILNLLFYFLLFLFDITGFIPLYLYVVGLSFIVASSFGIYSFRNKALKIIFITYMVLAQLVVTNVYPVNKRSATSKIYGKVDNFINEIDNSTPIVAVDAGRFIKYYFKDKNIYPIDYEELIGSHSKKWIRIIYGDKIANSANKVNYKDVISPFILNAQKSENLEKYLNDTLISKLKKGDKIVCIFSFDGHIYTYLDKDIRKKLSLPYYYEKENSTLKYQLTKNDDAQLTQEDLGQVIIRYSLKLIFEIIEKHFDTVKIEQFAPNENGVYVRVFEKTNVKSKTHDLLTKPLAGWIFLTYQKK